MSGLFWSCVRPSAPIPDFLEILKCLCRHGVDFIVVGGISAVLCGANINTFDLDVVHGQADDNLERLTAALQELEAVYRFQPERRLFPTRSHLASKGHQLLMTKFGPLDVLGAIGRGHSFDELSESSPTLELGPGMTIRVLGLETQIRIKEEVGSPKDLAVLPILRETLRERDR